MYPWVPLGLSFLDFMCLGFIKLKLLYHEVTLQNSNFSKGFQNSEFYEFLEANKITLHENVL